MRDAVVKDPSGSDYGYKDKWTEELLYISRYIEIYQT